MSISVFVRRVSRYVCARSGPQMVLFPKRFQSNLIKFQTLQEATQAIKNNVIKDEKVEIFLGTGQYFHHMTDERILALSFVADEGKMEPPTELLDAVVNSEDIEKLEDEISTLPECLAVKTGEVDSVHDSPWVFGFTTKPDFSVFSQSGYMILLKSLPKGYGFRLFDGSLSEIVYLSDIIAVQVVLSDEPWHERKVELLLKNNDILTVAEDIRGEGSINLSDLMMSTEWLVKMAGLICLVVRQRGGPKDVLLRLPMELRAEGNPWIEMRNKSWIDRVHKTDES